MSFKGVARGEIRNRDRYRQPVSFGGLVYGKITPTDVDGYIEYRDTVFVFFEVKLRGTSIGYGQLTALTRLVDNLRENGKHAIVIKCEHDEHDTDAEVDAACAEVAGVYWHTWEEKSGMTAREFIDKYYALLKECGVRTPLDEGGP